MARIIAYPNATNVSPDDCLIGTQKDNGTSYGSNPTKNFSVSSVIGAGLGYTNYTVLVSQSGVADPTAVELKNDTGATFTFNRQAPGVYLIVSSNPNLFTLNKTAVFINYGNPGSDGLPPKWSRLDAFRIQIETQDETGVLDDDILNNGAFEIRIYN